MKTLDWQTLRDDGYLQEVNRLFFHPLGLALAINVDDGIATLSIIDVRDDPEGFIFATGDLAEKAQRLKQIADARRAARIKGVGYWQQPVEPTQDQEGERVSETYPTPAHGWTCFHCGENFPGTMAGARAARMHFGPSVHSEPKCQISAYRIRQMEEQLRRYGEEDTDLHRQLRRMESDHLTALRDAEEKGYARGLRDAGYFKPGSES